MMNSNFEFICWFLGWWIQILNSSVFLWNPMFAIWHDLCFVLCSFLWVGVPNWHSLSRWFSHDGFEFRAGCSHRTAWFRITFSPIVAEKKKRLVVILPDSTHCGYDHHTCSSHLLPTVCFSDQCKLDMCHCWFNHVIYMWCALIWWLLTIFVWSVCWFSFAQPHWLDSSHFRLVFIMSNFFKLIRLHTAASASVS